MKEKPILFSGPMVRAILAGTKTQTRRVVKLPKWAGANCIETNERDMPLAVAEATGCLSEVSCPYGQPGDRLWVREAWCCVHGVPDAGGVPHPDDFVRYRADAGPGEKVISDVRGWHPSIHMPRVYSRLTLEMTAVRVERLNDISEADAMAEGVEVDECGHAMRENDVAWGGARTAYADLWEQINGPGSWAADPWVWVIEFKRV